MDSIRKIQVETYGFDIKVKKDGTKRYTFLKNKKESIDIEFRLINTYGFIVLDEGEYGKYRWVEFIEPDRFKKNMEWFNIKL